MKLWKEIWQFELIFSKPHLKLHPLCSAEMTDCSYSLVSASDGDKAKFSRCNSHSRQLKRTLKNHTDPAKSRPQKLWKIQDNGVNNGVCRWSAYTEITVAWLQADNELMFSLPLPHTHTLLPFHWTDLYGCQQMWAVYRHDLSVLSLPILQKIKNKTSSCEQQVHKVFCPFPFWR